MASTKTPPRRTDDTGGRLAIERSGQMGNQKAGQDNASRERSPRTVRPTGKVRPTGRARMNLMVDPRLLDRAARAVGSSNKSEVVNLALVRLAEDEAVVAGLDAAFGAIPDFAADDTP